MLFVSFKDIFFCIWEILFITEIESYENKCDFKVCINSRTMFLEMKLNPDVFHICHVKIYLYLAILNVLEVFLKTKRKIN